MSCGESGKEAPVEERRQLRKLHGRLGVWVLLAGASVAACAEDSSASPPSNAPLSPEQVARVGKFVLREEGAKRLLALGEGSLAKWIESALLAEGQRVRAPDYASAVERVAMGQRLLEVLLEQARAQGPPTDAEVEELTQSRWWELARPRMVEVVHAVVLATPPNEAAKEVARKVRQAVLASKDVKDFQTRARKVESGELELKVESLPPVAPDGRALFPERPPPAGPRQTEFVQSFADAAQRLSAVGDVSPVVATNYGYHVLQATRIIAADQPGLEERRRRLATEIYGARADRSRTELLSRLRGEAHIRPTRSAVSRMGGLKE